MINQSALSGFWRFDDGWLLDYASRFSPFDYFFTPAITRGYSLYNLTPFNPFLFDIDLWLFGFSPRDFYVQHLTVMSGCAITTFLLLRIWLPSRFALSGAVLFLIGAPSLIVSQQLMVGHYIMGLLFTLLSVYFYVRSFDNKSWWHLILATLFYVAATTCKEIYVPLPITLLFIQRGSLVVRLQHITPMFIWTACYAIWRYFVLGSFIGGYDSGGIEVTFLKSVQQLSQIPQLLFGSTFLGFIAIAVFILLLGYSLWRRKLNLSLMAVVGVTVILPLIPLLKFPGITQPDRYLFLPWWLVSIMFIVLISNLPSYKYPYRTSLGLLVIISVALYAHQVRNKIQPMFKEFDTTYRFFTSQADNMVFLSGNKNAYYQDTVLNGARNALARTNNIKLQRVGILTHRDYIPNLKKAKFSVVQYDSTCNCIREARDRKSDNSSSNKTRKPEILVFKLKPPFPPLFEYGDGKIDTFKVKGNSLYVTGWTNSPVEDIEQQFLVVTPIKPEQTKLISEAIDANAFDKQRHRFSLNLIYHDPKSAALSESGICLLVRSMLTPLQLIQGPDHNGCTEFLRFFQ
ncbi:MAG: hypothetical protein P8179_12085 [Candidatus Thiodiazotropha sp.]